MFNKKAIRVKHHMENAERNLHVTNVSSLHGNYVTFQTMHQFDSNFQLESKYLNRLKYYLKKPKHKNNCSAEMKIFSGTTKSVWVRFYVYNA